MSRSKARAGETCVVVLGSNQTTLEELDRYFSDTGIKSSGRSALTPLEELLPSVQVVVIFPDDFPEPRVATYLAEIGDQRPELTVIIVTQSPAQYRAATSANGNRLRAHILPRPSFGWTILDAIRDALSSRTG